MSKRVLWSVVVIVLCFIGGFVSAQEQDSGRQQPRRDIPAVVSVTVQGPNVTSANSVEPRLEPNAHDLITRQREMIRSRTRERIHQRAMERSQPVESQSAQPGPRRGRAMDVNSPAGIKDRPMGARPGEKPGRSRRDKDTPADKTIDKGAVHQQQLSAIEQQISHEEARHRDRMARLNRIHELAAQQNDAETLSRVEKLLEQEQQRYDAKHERMTQRKSRITEFLEKAAPDESKKAAGGDVNTNSNKPSPGNK